MHIKIRPKTCARKKLWKKRIARAISVFYWIMEDPYVYQIWLRSPASYLTIQCAYCKARFFRTFVLHSLYTYCLIFIYNLNAPAVEDDLPNCDWINFETNGPSPVAISVVQQKAHVFSMNVLFVRMALVAGKISFNRPWMCSSRGGKSPSLIAAILRSRAPGISLG